MVAQLAPIFPAKQPPACHAGGGELAHDTVEQRGELRLSVAVSGKEYPWEFVKLADGSATITGRAPPGPLFPEGGRVYLVWELPNAVKWQFAGGFVEEIPPGATWTVAPLRAAAGGGKEDAGVELVPTAPPPPPAA